MTLASQSSRICADHAWRQYRFEFLPPASAAEFLVAPLSHPQVSRRGFTGDDHHRVVCLRAIAALMEHLHQARMLFSNPTGKASHFRLSFGQWRLQQLLVEVVTANIPNFIV